MAIDVTLTGSERDALDPRDIRTGGSWSPAQRAKNLLIRVLVRCTLFAADRTPISLLRHGLRSIGYLVGQLPSAARCRAAERVRRMLPGEDAERIAQQAFAAAGESLAACLALRRGHVRASQLVSLGAEDEQLLRSVLSAGRGAVVVCAHLGPFELVPALVAELGLRPAVVVRESYDPGLDPLVDAHRRARGVTVIHRGEPGAAARMLRALRGGQPLGLLPDLPGRVATRRARLLASDWCFAAGPARLARRAGVPLLSALLRPCPGRSGRFRLHIVELTHTDEDTMTQRVADQLGAALRAWPAGWLWMHAGRTANCANFRD